MKRVTPGIAALAATLAAALAGPGSALAAIDFTISPQPAYPGEQVQLSDTAPDPKATDTWDTDNDGFTDQKGPQVTVGPFGSPGSYPMSLFRGGEKVTHDVVVRARPHASFTFAPGSPETGQQVTFSSTSTPDGLSASWDLNGDGVYGDATGGSASTSFSTPGQHTVGLQVSDGRTSDSTTAVVTVDAPPSLTPRFTTGGTPQAGAPTRFDASGSTAPHGTHIVAHLWDFDGDGHADANTGDLPLADFRFGHPGSHSVGLAVEDSTGQISQFVHQDVSISPGAPGCLPEVDLGWLSLVGACIHHSGTTYTLDLGAGAQANGLSLVGNAGSQLTLETGGSQWTLSSRGEVRAQLANTPAGTITLFRRDLGSQPIVLPVGAAHASPGAPGLLLGSFPIAPSCPPAPPGPVPDLCAHLPGGFPLTGSVALYLVPPLGAHPPALTVRGRAMLGGPFSATGEFSVGADRDTGPRIDTLAFDVSGAEIGLGRLDHIGLHYTRLAAGGALDVWEGDARGSLRVPGAPGLSGRMRFANSRFQTASLATSGRVVLAPSLSLDSLSGTLQANPFLLTGAAALTIGPGHAVGSVRAEGSGTGSHLQVKGALTGYLGLPLPSATVDLWAGGGAQISAALDQHVTAGPLHLLDASASLSGFFAPPAPGHVSVPAMQLEGRGSFAVPGLAGSGDMLFNQHWIAACGNVHGAIGPSFTGGFRLRQPPRGLSDFTASIGSCDLGPLRATASAARAAASGSHAFRVRPGTPGLELEVTGDGGVPQLRVSGPGANVDTSASAVVRRGPVLAVPNADTGALYVYLHRPRAGAWRLTELPGSAHIARVRSAAQAPPIHVTGKVTRHGARASLRYRITGGTGDSVRFVELGAAVHQIGVARGRRGTLRFAPAAGAGRRRVVAIVERSGATIAQRTIASYRAPAGGPGRPGTVRIRRRGGHAVVSWGRAARAVRYLVDVSGSDGRRVGYSVRGRSATIAALPPGVGVSATVRGADGAGRVGPSRAARLRPKR